jgi:hypothetical protein
MKKQINFLLVLLFLQCLTATTLLSQTGLIAYYPFNGNAHDETGNGYNGTVSGATLSDDRFGNPMSAYNFDGINDKIVIGKEPNFPSWNKYAVSLWFLNDGGGDHSNGYGQKILSKAKFNSDFHLSVLHSDGRLIWWSVQGGFNSVEATNQDYRDNQWHHVVLNKNSPSNGDIWVDGVLQNSSNTLGAVFNSEDLVIGFTTHSDGYQQKYWSGKIDDIRIYNRVLSESEISDLFTESLCHPPTGMKVQDISDTAAILKWQVAGADILHVRVRYRAVSGTTWAIKNKKGAYPSLHINELLPNTTYQWQLKSFCAEDTSGWVKGPDFTTAASFASSPATSAITGNKLAVNTHLQIMPNPNKGNFTIQAQLPAKAANTTLALYNNRGEKIWQQDAGKMSGAVYKNISLQDQLPAGIYMMVIQRNDARLEQKIVISK